VKYLYWTLCILISVFMNYLGYNMATWQWWVGCGLVWLSCICGYAIKEREK